MRFLKKLLYVTLSIALVLSLCAVNAFADSVDSEPTDNNVYFVAGGDSIVKVDEAQYAEVLNGATIESIITRDGLQTISIPQAKQRMPLIVNEMNTVESNAKTTGSWTITSNTIGSNSRTYYSKPDGSNFSVASTEYIEMRVTPTTVRGFEVGYTGTSEGSYYAYIEQAGQTAVIAFVDRITVPGSYKTFIGNSAATSLTVSGSISVLKR